MSETKDIENQAKEGRDRAGPAEGGRQPAAGESRPAPEAEGARHASGEQPDGEPAPAAEGSEADILRGELERAQRELAETQERMDDMRDRFLRARADLENYRRRSAAELERARESGLDSAVLTVLSVFDDLKRALAVADGGDPSQIVPGIEAVLSSLERNLDSLGIKPVGSVGERFDPDLHEALTSVPTDRAEQADTIAEVFQVGFLRGDRLIRPARVVVYQAD